jgi:uncharacterized membrane protein
MLGIVLVSFALSFYFAPQMPSQIANHWGISGYADGYAPKDLFSLFGIPSLIAVLALLFIAIPKIDPLGKNIEKFGGHYYGFAVVFLLFMLYIHILSITYNLGTFFNFGQLMLPGLALLLYYVGILVENSKPNWFVGIRTPWTMSSEKVWNKTHAIGGKLFKATGIITLIGLFMPEIGFIAMMGMILAIVVFSFVYSYVEFQKEQTMGKREQKRKSGRKRNN